MKYPALIYLNLALAAAVSLVYSMRDGDAQPRDGELHVVLISNFPAGSSAAIEAESAAQAFEQDWRGRVTLIESPSDAPALARALKRAMALDPDGVSMPGARDTELLMPFIADALRQGIRVTFHTDPMPDAERRFRQFGTGYAGDRSELSGRAFARLATTSLRIQADTRVLAVGSETEPAPGYRMYGCIEQLKELGFSPEYIAAVEAGGAELATSGTLRYAALVDRLKAEPQPDVIFWDGGPVGDLVTILDGSDLDHNTVSVATMVPAGVELMDEELAYLKLQANERIFLACYLSLVQLHLAEERGLPGIQVPASGV